MFAEDMTRLFGRADPEMPEDRKLRYLMRGVKEQLFAGLVRNPPTTVAEFTKEATATERALQQRYRQQNPLNVRASSPVTTAASLCDNDRPLQEVIRKILREELRQLGLIPATEPTPALSFVADVVRDEVRHALSSYGYNAGDLCAGVAEGDVGACAAYAGDVCAYAAEGAAAKVLVVISGLNFSLSHTFNAMLDKSLLPMSVSLNSSDSREFYLGGLFPGSTYLICVEAATSAGFGNAICENFSTKASVPEVQIGPQVGAVVHNEVSITLYPVNFVKGPITSYYVLVLREGEVITRPVRLVNYTTSQDMGLGYYVAACLTPGQLEQPMDFVVGSGSLIGGFENPPLSEATTYWFGLLVESNFSGDVLQGYSLTAAVTVNGGSDSAGVGVIIGASLVIICLIGAAMATMSYCIRKRRQTIYRSESSTRQSMKVLSRLSKSGGNVTPESSSMITKNSKDYLMMAVVTHHGLSSKPVSVLRLQEYISHGERTGFLKEEYMVGMPSIRSLNEGLRLAE
ncbi:hypothetical protein HPB51_010642 [Rhipicephalus microplus]|uniref:Receptor-type tyrosine-protein phosphatase U-like Fn3 domain-containing protein n=1 Tax=Rhipicephalus microplus TaxID=6941 RepID=A0A9J6ENB4_RHIMP|nr:hypothetical protein HPB51_010642 [Rhipicephalus microplus]